MFLESIKGNQVCKERHEMNITKIDSLRRIAVLKSAWRLGHLE
jgi:hypothetical protein